ncbi:MAG: hypothetical protein JOZ41_11985, partial [Chloroflexi bacterium]|nr:hypothetical protein [Chloroflexota bacterium]
MGRKDGLRPQLVYSPAYDITFFGLEKLHPFDTRKYSHAWHEIERAAGAGVADLVERPSRPISDEELLTVHDAGYLERLDSPQYVAAALEGPLPGWVSGGLIRDRVLTPMRLATMGTAMAARKALDGGIGINLSGGYHHASRDRGEGFCLYSDISVAVALLRQGGKLRSSDTILIVDLDVHQGNGLERIYRDDASVRIFDIYNQDIYPGDLFAAERIDWKVPIGSGTGDLEYLRRLRDELPACVRSLPRPALAFYNAGTDVYEGDLLGRLSLTVEGVLQRDRVVFERRPRPASHGSWCRAEGTAGRAIASWREAWGISWTGGGNSGRLDGTGGAMAQKEIEVILMRQLASYLVTPIFIVDPAGTLVFYNEPAESILGLRFDETGEMQASEWSTTFVPVNHDGTPLPPEDLPLMVALQRQRPARRSFWIRGLDNVQR